MIYFSDIYSLTYNIFTFSLYVVHTYSSHSYLFFNQDGMSLTFVGFMESKAGDLIDANKSVIEHGLMTPQLQAALKDQAVNFEDNYQTWSKQKMVQKIGTVMGLTLVQDPDMSYVLTVDNLLKILAIQMRFRYCSRIGNIVVHLSSRCNWCAFKHCLHMYILLIKNIYILLWLEGVVFQLL